LTVALCCYRNTDFKVSCDFIEVRGCRVRESNPPVEQEMFLHEIDVGNIELVYAYDGIFEVALVQASDLDFCHFDIFDTLDG
jgi:hypothetical protein